MPNIRISNFIKIVLLAGLIALFASACGSSNSDDSTGSTTVPSGTGSVTRSTNTGTGGGEFIQVGLQSLGDCDALTNRFKTEALKIVGPYGLGDRGPRLFFAEPAIARTQAPNERQDVAADESSASFSTTNVQVKGVDEPDLVKTDGNRIVGISSGELWIVDVSASPARKVASLILAENYQSLEMFLYKDKVIAILNSFGSSEFVESRFATDSVIYPQGVSTAHIIEIDITDNKPEVTREMILEGSYINARRTGSTVNLVVDSQKTSTIGFVNPVNEAGEEIAEETNRQVVLNSVLTDWVPEYSIVDESREEIQRGLMLPCPEVLFPNEFSGLDVTSVVTLDLEEDLTTADFSAVVADGNSIYSSGKNLYLAHQLYRFSPIFREVEDDGNDSTPDEDENDEPREEIWFHKFSTPDGETASYQASGKVKGRFLNQFSMHETAEEDFWIVSTVNPDFSNPETREEEEEEVSESFVTSFRQVGSTLEQSGSVGNIGRDEQVRSVRFIADRAYVVTFRQIDPFYVIDLSDPNNPEIKGELKIPGFSSYLHPLGNDQLLGVGRNATDEGVVTGAKLSLFDASNPQDPQEVRTLNLGSGFTNVEWDHRAVLYWAREDRFILPFASYQTDFFGALAIHIDPDATQLFEVQRFRHQDSTSTSTPSFTIREAVERAIVINDGLWTLSDNFLELRSIANPEDRAQSRIRVTALNR